jgi:hypothetical protein
MNRLIALLFLLGSCAGPAAAQLGGGGTKVHDHSTASKGGTHLSPTTVTVNNNKLVVKPDGKVGRGTANPQNDFHVIGGVRVDTNTNVGNPALWVSTTNGSVGIGTANPGSTRLSIRTTGSGTTTWALGTKNRDGTDGLWVRDDARVGIGTQNPSQLFAIAGNGDEFVSYSNAAGDWRLGMWTSDGLGLITNGFSRLTINSYGGVIISTGNNKSATLMTLKSDNNPRAVGDHVKLDFYMTNPNGLNRQAAAIAAVIEDQPASVNTSGIHFLTENAMAVSTKAVITGSGNFGIGTTSPSGKVHALGATGTGAVIISSGARTGGSYSTLLQLQDTGSRFPFEVRYYEDHLRITHTDSASVASIRVSTWTSSPGYVNQVHVGEGTFTPTHKTSLHVKGALRLIDDSTEPDCSATTKGLLYYRNTGSGIKDVLAICAKDSSNTYAWRTIY